LFFKELDYGLVKCWLVRRGVVVAFAFGGVCGWYCFENPGYLLVGGVCLPIEYQDRYVYSPEAFRRQTTVHQRITNDGHHYFRIGSGDPDIQ
jgi:hypothetical protein